MLRRRRGVSGSARFGLARHQVDQRRHAVMTAALVDLGIMLFEKEQIESGEGPAQQLGGVKVSDVLGAAGAVFELIRPVTLEEQGSARPQTFADAAENDLAQVGTGELAKDAGDDVEAVVTPIPDCQ